MVFVRIAVLLFLTAYGWGMGQAPSHELNGFGRLVAGLFFIAAPALYFLPTYEAWTREQPNLTSIALVNLFLGWSLIGWLVALVWAVKKPAEPVPVVIAPPAPAQAAVSEPENDKETKLCPYCAEEVLAAAIKCKHCGSDLRVTPQP